VVEIIEEGGKPKKAKVDYEISTSPAGGDSKQATPSVNGSAKKSKKCKKKKLAVE